MVSSIYIIKTSDKKFGIEMDEDDLKRLIKLCYIRNMKMYIKLIGWHEHLENRKFDKEYYLK